MLTAELSVMRRESVRVPISPALRCRIHAIEPVGIRRPRHEPIRFTEGVLRNARASEGALLSPGWQQRASSQSVSLCVAPASREHETTRRATCDDGKGAPVGFSDRVGVELA